MPKIKDGNIISETEPYRYKDNEAIARQQARHLQQKTSDQRQEILEKTIAKIINNGYRSIMTRSGVEGLRETLLDQPKTQSIYPNFVGSGDVVSTFKFVLSECYKALEQPVPDVDTLILTARMNKIHSSTLE
jgi:hypothetical protein